MVALDNSRVMIDNGTVFRIFEVTEYICIKRITEWMPSKGL